MEGSPLLKTEPYKLYKRRWFMLFVVAMFNFSNAMIWISYASIANDASAYYQVDENKVNWFSTIYFICSVVFGLPAFWLIDNVGLRTAVLTGTWVNAIGAIIRMIASLDVGSSNRYWVALIGQIIAASAQPIVLPMPTKVAAIWFGENERTLANTIATIGNPLGVLAASALAPVVVKHPNDMKLLMVIFSIPAIFTALMATVGVCSSTPKSPPSSSAHIEPEPFIQGLKKALRKKSYLNLMCIFGYGVASFSTVTSLLQQIICTKGYNNDIAGLCGALVIVGGLVFSAIASVYVDKTKKFEETAKVMVLLTAIASCLVLISTNLYNETAFLCISFLMFGMALGVAPVFLELGVECTYPVPEATSAGFMWLVGQLIGIVLMFGLPLLGRKLTPEEKRFSKCNVPGSNTVEELNLSNAMILTVGLLFFLSLVFVFLFRADYLRMHSEHEQEKDDSTKNMLSRSPINQK